MDQEYQNLDSAVVSGVSIIGGIFYLAFIVVLIVAMWKTFEKAGKPGWASIIPIYNTIVILEIIGKPIWWFLLLFIPFVNIVIGIMIMNGISKSFGKGTGFTLGLIFLTPIFFLILGFGDAKYIGPVEDPNFAGPNDSNDFIQKF